LSDANAERKEIERELGDRYQIVRTLGRGAFGAVYLARERQLHRLVAIKALHADRAWSDDERTRLLREARTVANLSHPAIVPLLAFGETASTVYMVMPYVSGETLAERLKRDDRMDAGEVRRILIEIADGLAYAHGEGVLHRDLKPENIVLERAGAVDDDVPPRVRLIDFGVAAFPGRDGGVGATYETWGTAQFMAPEQAFGEPELDPRSDVYSLGVLGFLLLGGRLPFDTTSPTERLLLQRQGPSTPLSVCAPDAPADLIAAIERCLAYEPEGRWRRARELRDALVRGAGTPGVALDAISLVRQRLRTARRRPIAPPAPRRVVPRSPFGGIETDIRFAIRTLRKAPGFTAAIVLTLALGLGATTAIFSALHALVLRPLPVADPRSLVVVQEKRVGPNPGVTDFGAITFQYDRYVAYQNATTNAFSGIAAQLMRTFSLRVGNQARPITGLVTSSNYFEVLGVRPALGRFYTGSGDRPDRSEPVAVVGYDFWQNVLGGDRTAVGRTLYVDSRPLTIVGVAPRGFRGAFAGVFASDVWVPAATYRQPAPASRGSAATETADLWMIVFGRLKPGVDMARASAMLRLVAPRVPMEDTDTRAVDAWVEPLSPISQELERPVEQFMTMLLAVAAVVLLIAASNAAGMFLARAAARGREIATRLAVGASRGQLVRQLVIESVVLSVPAAALGLLLTWWLTRLLNGWQPPFPFAAAIGFQVNGTVLAVAAATMLGTSLLAGLAPALHASNVDLAAAMKQGGAQSGLKRTRLRNGFVVGQVALSVLLLAVAGLFVRSLRRTLAVNPGLDPAGVVHVQIALEPHGYDHPAAAIFLARLLDRVRSRPEIVAASYASGAPLGGTNISQETARRSDRPDAKAEAQWATADVGLIELMRTPLLAGRTIRSTDTRSTPRVVVINETLSRRLWPGETPAQVLGHEIQRDETRYAIVGVMSNGKYMMPQEDEQGFGYFPFTQRFTRSPDLFIRARGTTAAALQAAREELRLLDPNVALQRPTLLAEDVAKWTIPQQVGAFLVGIFGVVGLLLAATGLYGVLAFGVTQRLREFGIRMALGARAADVVRLVVRSGMMLLVIGVGLGLAAAFAAGGLVSSFLFGFSPRDPLTLIAVPLTLAAVALVATVIPARRAATADPMASLRAE
jgi:predicted permease